MQPLSVAENQNRTQVLEDLLEGLACTFCDFPCAFRGSNRDVLATFGGTCANSPGGIDRVQRNEIDGTLAGALGDIARAFGCTFADVAASTSNVSAGAPGV
jgi:hypothetical protein